MRGNVIVTRVPTTISRKVRMPKTVRGISEELHSLSPNDRVKTTINYLKNSPPPTPVLQISSISSKASSKTPSISNYSRYNFSRFEERHQKKRLQKRSSTSFSGKRKEFGSQALEENKEVDEKVERTEKNEIESPYSLENVASFRFLLMKSRMPVFRDKSCFLMSKEEYESRLPKIMKVFRKIKKRKVL